MRVDGQHVGVARGVRGAGGIPALVFVPAGKVAAGKLAQTLAYGAKTLLVRGDFDDCLALAREASAALGIHLLNSVNPFRLEGQKTIVFELLEQLEWNAPDWIALPAGNLGNTSAFGKALREAHAIGLIDRVPRIAAIQAERRRAVRASFRDGFRERIAVEPETVATAIRIGAPASWNRAVRAIRETNGVVRRRDRRGDSRGEGGDRRGGRRLRAGERGERRRRRASSSRRRDRARTIASSRC